MTFFDAWTFLTNHKIFNISEKSSIAGFDRELIKLLSAETLNSGYIESRTSIFEKELSVNVVRIDPEIKAINTDYPELNVQTEVWLEAIVPMWDEDKENILFAHDISLDLGGKTFEEAILKLANLVNKTYGDDTLSSEILIGY